MKKRRYAELMAELHQAGPLTPPTSEAGDSNAEESDHDMECATKRKTPADQDVTMLAEVGETLITSRLVNVNAYSKALQRWRRWSSQRQNY